MNTLRLGPFTNFATDFSEISIISIEFRIISQQLKLFSTISSTRGEIHEQEVNLDNLLSFSCGNLSKVLKPRYPSDANSRQRDKRKFELFNPSQARGAA